MAIQFIKLINKQIINKQTRKINGNRFASLELVLRGHRKKTNFRADSLGPLERRFKDYSYFLKHLRVFHEMPNIDI